MQSNTPQSPTTVTYTKQSKTVATDWMNRNTEIYIQIWKENTKQPTITIYYTQTIQNPKQLGVTLLPEPYKQLRLFFLADAEVLLGLGKKSPSQKQETENNKKHKDISERKPMAVCLSLFCCQSRPSTQLPRRSLVTLVFSNPGIPCQTV